MYKSYRTLEIFSDLFRILGFLVALIAFVYVFIVVVGGAATLPTEPASAGAIAILALPAIGIFVSGMLLIAVAESIRLAVDCAARLTEIAANTKRAD